MASSTGFNVKDVLPIPENADHLLNDKDGETSNTLADPPTVASHALATADHEEKGHAQQNHDAEVKDLGWTETNDKIPSPLVAKLPNEELWVLVRRFNKQTYHFIETTKPVPGNLDLNIADEEEFSPDKLRANFERLYMTVIIGLMGFGKHIVRLRSWRERRRTAAFCAAYTIAWMLDLLIPLLSATIVALIVYPPSRELLFPPAPMALVSGKTGGVQKPKAGVLGSTDSATGAPERHKGEAVEAEASNFVNSIASVGLAAASGKHPQNDPSKDQDGDTPSDSVPDPTAIAMGSADARSKATGGGKAVKHDKTKAPVENAMWSKMRPIMHGIADFNDTWERFANALSPTPPFPKDVYRLRLASLVVPLLAGSFFISSYMFVKGVTFGIGFGFFGDPVITPGLQYLNSHYPNWQKLLELRNTLLKGVPTNAQLTITILRIGEANKAPIPPPPHLTAPPEDKPVDLNDSHLNAIGPDTPMGATDAELKDAMAHDPSVPHQDGGADIEASKKSSHGKKGHHVLSAVKRSIRGTVQSALGADHLKAKVGSEHSKNRLGVIPPKEVELSGPIEFKCRNKGKRGHAYISTRATIPCISFSIDKSIAKEGITDRDDDTLHPIWSIAVADIKELKKIGGLGWKAKLVVGWALDTEVADGLEIVDRAGDSYTVTACVLRDELFNRLASMGGQKWESW